jgi:hypothetical protein
MRKRVLVRISLHGMTNEKIAELFDEIGKLIKKRNPGALGVSAAYNEKYLPLLVTLFALLDLITHSKLTPKIEQADKTRDDSFNGLRDTVKGLTRHPDAAIRAAAIQIYRVIKHYGDLTRKEYDRESAASTDLYLELNTPENKALVTLLGIIDWLERFKAANDEFITLMLARYEEIGNRPAQRMQELRLSLAEALDEILDRIEAQITLYGLTSTSSDYAPFVHDYNALVERYKRTTRRATKKDKEGEEL